MKVIELKPIGIIHTPFTEKDKTPIQPIFSPDSRGTIELFPEYADGLKDIEGLSHLIVLYQFHREKSYCLHVKPFLDDTERGVFATRHYKRPNFIGISIVRLESVHENMLEISEVDMLDGTPLLDIKPYVEEFDVRQGCRQGWYVNAANPDNHQGTR